MFRSRRSCGNAQKAAPSSGTVKSAPEAARRALTCAGGNVRAVTIAGCSRPIRYTTRRLSDGRYLTLSGAIDCSSGRLKLR